MKQTVFGKFFTALCLLLLASQPYAQGLAGSALVDALREGGLVLVMRHTNSPRTLPDAATANPDNVNRERQLDEKGRSDAVAMGDALRRLGVPVTEVLSSPTYRALETARLAGLDDVQAQEQLSNEGMRDSSTEKAQWLRAQVADKPESGNRILITHGPNLSAAFPDDAAGMGEGDALVFDPDGSSGPVVVARIGIADWARL